MVLTPRNIVAGFMAGALSVLLFHQGAYFIMSKFGLVSNIPWRLTGSIPPFGVPDLVNQMFWGGMWGILFALVIDRMPRVPTWVNGMIFGMLGPLLLGGWVIVSLIKGRPLFADYFSDFNIVRLRNNFLLNGVAFGLGLGIIYSLLPSRGGTDYFRGPDPTNASNFAGYLSFLIGVVVMYLALSGMVLKGTQSSPLLALVGIAIAGYGFYQLQRANA